MKTKLQFILIAFSLLAFPVVSFGTVTLGAAASKFVIYSSSGAITDNPSAHSHVTGNVGNLGGGSVTGFGNVDGVMNVGADSATTPCEIDLQATITQLNASPATLFPPSGTLGNGVIFTPGVYSIPGDATLNLVLTLDALGDPNAEFIIKIGGLFDPAANSQVKLVNGALACHVFWQVTGAVTMASPVTMRGNVISGGQILMGSLDSLEGRLFSTTGLIGVDQVTAFTPIGCNSPYLTGPTRPDLLSLACYTIFSGGGALDGNLSTTSIGDVGNSGGGSVTGWTAGNVTGTLHGTGDPSTMLAATDLLNVYDTLHALAPDINLLYPLLFGRDLVVTPHTYILDAANGTPTLTDSLYLNAEGNPNAVFVFKIVGGALVTSVNAKVKLMNGAQSKNVFWLVEGGAMSINNGSTFRGNIVVQTGGAINLVSTGVVLDGRALAVAGAITTAGCAAAMTPGCSSGSPDIMTQPVSQTVCAGSSATYSVTAVGAGLAYQWRKGTTNLANGPTISGANASTLIINPVSLADTSTSYNVIVTGSLTPPDTSVNVFLKVNTAPIITTEPVSQASCAGGLVMFSVVASGTNITYQWRKDNSNLSNFGTISGVTSDTLKINPSTIADTSSNYYVVVTGTCSPNDTSLHVSFTIDSPQIITQPASQTICTGSSVSFSVGATGGSLGYQWRNGIVNLINGPNISGVHNATLVINPATIADTSSFYNVVVTGGCLPNTTSNNASLSVNPLPVPTPGSNATICNGSSVTLGAASVVGHTYLWTPTTGLSSATVSNPVASPLITRTYSLTETVTATTCQAMDTVKITVNLAPNAIAGANVSICNGSSVTLGAAPVIGHTYSWTPTTGLSSSTVSNPVANPSTPTTYSLTETITATGCQKTNPVTVGMNASPTATTGSNTTICNGSSVTLGAPATAGHTYSWTPTTGLSSTSVSNPVATPPGTMTYSLTETITATGCQQTDSVKVTVNQIPTVNGGSDQTVCNNATIAAIPFSGSIAGTTFNWTNDNPTIGLAASGSGSIASFTATNPGTNPINGTIIVTPTANGCSGPITNFSITVNPTLIAVPVSNSPVCAGSPMSLAAESIAGGIYNWTGPNGYASSARDTIIPVAVAANAGTYSLIVSCSCGCTSLPATINVLVNDCSIDLGVVKTVNNTHPVVGQTVIFTITATNAGPNDATGVTVSDTLQSGYTFVSSSATSGVYELQTGVWTIGTLAHGTSAVLTITATVNPTGNYLNTAAIKGTETDVNPANDISSVLTEPVDFFIPQGYSPNGDGINDLFVVRGIVNYPGNSITIFNRWGNKVFEASPYQNTWDGKCTIGLSVGGDQLPVGTYFYIFNLGDGSPVLKGTIYLNR